MTKHYDTGISFMGHRLYVAFDEGVYGENEHRNQEEVAYLKERLKDFAKSQTDGYPGIYGLDRPKVT